MNNDYENFGLDFCFFCNASTTRAKSPKKRACFFIFFGSILSSNELRKEALNNSTYFAEIRIGTATILIANFAPRFFF
jgi:hypothetical protein